MDAIRYIHVADLHLDTPFVGLTRSAPSDLAAQLRKAPFTALDNLVRLCETEKPDFLLLAGDIYNEEERSIKAQLCLADACRKLEKLNIPVFIVYGNHDPLGSQLASIDWPANVVVFGAEPASHILAKVGEPYAIVHGISHANGRESRNLASLFKRDGRHKCFQIGLLHCNVDNAVKSDRYAPCSLADLKSSGLDAWALGHAHERRILSNAPFIAYSGNAQGLRASENGAKGCFVVTARHQENGWICDPEFKELGPVRWEKRTINLDDIASLNALEDKVLAEIQDLHDQCANSSAIVATLNLTGRSEIDSEIRSFATFGHLAEWCADVAAQDNKVWVREIEINTAPPISTAANLERDDLLGEIARLARELEEQPEKLAEFGKEALKPLCERKKLGALLEPLNPQILNNLLITAQRIAQDALEAK